MKLSVMEFFMTEKPRFRPVKAGSLQFDWNKPVVPFGAKLAQSIEYLKFRAQNFNAVSAYQRIEKFVAEQQKYRLYRRYFPQEWNDSRASLFKTGYYENYTERTNEFFDLVNKNLFPFLSGWNEDPETELDNFSIFSLNVDFCCEEIEYENLRVSYAMALLFFSGDEELWEYLSANYHLDKNDFSPIATYAFDGLWNLEKAGRCGLYLTILEVIDHSTGNPWLDTTNCHDTEFFSWDEKTVDLLTESYRKAERILQETELLDELIEANPQEVLTEMISLWNTGKIAGTSGKRAAGKTRKKRHH